MTPAQAVMTVTSTSSSYGLERSKEETLHAGNKRRGFMLPGDTYNNSSMPLASLCPSLWQLLGSHHLGRFLLMMLTPINMMLMLMMLLMMVTMLMMLVVLLMII